MPECHRYIIPSRHGQCNIHRPQFPNLLDLTRLLKMNSGRKFQFWNRLGLLTDAHRDMFAATKILATSVSAGVWISIMLGIADLHLRPKEFRPHLLLSHLHLLHRQVDLLELAVVEMDACHHQILGLLLWAVVLLLLGGGTKSPPGPRGTVAWSLGLGGGTLGRILLLTNPTLGLFLLRLAASWFANVCALE